MNLIIVILNLITAIILFICESKAHDKIVFCYYPSWSVYRTDDDSFSAKNINPYLCTHIGYVFSGLSKEGSIVTVDEKYAFLDRIDDLEHLRSLKLINQNLKTILVIGGRAENAKKLSELTQSYMKIQLFIEATIETLELYGFNGLDIDWEYPTDTRSGGIIEDKYNFITFLQMFKTRLDQFNYTLSVSVAAQESKAKIYYNISEMHKYLDFINLKTYDFYGIWNGKTSFHSPLEGTEDKKLNVMAAVDYWIQNGVPADKLILGLSFYGHTFQLKNKMNNGVNAEILGISSSSIYSKENGILAYAEICAKLKNNTLIEEFNEDMKSAYAYNDHLWISYENGRSIYYKINYVKEKNLKGVMIWSIDADDSKKICGRQFPLVNLINDILNNKILLEPEHHKKMIGQLITIDKSKTFKNFVCPSIGLFPKNNNCKAFYVCNEAGNNQPIVMFCPNRLLFDGKLGKCNWPAIVNCTK